MVMLGMKLGGDVPFKKSIQTYLMTNVAQDALIPFALVSYTPQLYPSNKYRTKELLILKRNKKSSKLSLQNYTTPPGHHNHRSFPEAAPPSLVVGSSLTITARFHLHRFHHRSSATASKISTSAWLPPTTSPSIDD
ncbi:hypothetical protein QVD17_09676 [Tagetes erecta]|uniref:Uncharacterized protein n=1 Tax=Tagetes erecta TaxID=13708 RepID=A0AAD8L4T3_TARER|nr:hypothetical protein QVD17_09676 [Tagetes erecta]